METATKNKRGRPAKFSNEYYSMWQDKEKRAAQNTYYASMIILMMESKRGSFFVTDRGNLRRQGIAEKIGRLYCAGKLTEDQAKELTQAAIDQYQSGATVKEVERTIKAFSDTYLN